MWIIFDLEALVPKALRHVGKVRRDYNEVCVRRVDRFNVAVHRKATDQAPGTKRIDHGDQHCKILRTFVRGQVVGLRCSHTLT